MCRGLRALPIVSRVDLGQISIACLNTSLSRGAAASKSNQQCSIAAVGNW
jgi:hypothetical protein